MLPNSSQTSLTTLQRRDGRGMLLRLEKTIEIPNGQRPRILGVQPVRLRCRRCAISARRPDAF
jgi:hypothetical protein